MKTIKVETIIKSDIENVWKWFTLPEHIVKWNQASEDWHCPRAINDLWVDGKFSFTMASRDGARSFDFGGTYNRIDEKKKIDYTIEDGRKVSVIFEVVGERDTKVTEEFEIEDVHSEDLQKAGWQSILDSLKKHVEANA